MELNTLKFLSELWCHITVSDTCMSRAARQTEIDDMGRGALCHNWTLSRLCLPWAWWWVCWPELTRECWHGTPPCQTRESDHSYLPVSHGPPCSWTWNSGENKTRCLGGFTEQTHQELYLWKVISTNASFVMLSKFKVYFVANYSSWLGRNWIITSALE